MSRSSRMDSETFEAAFDATAAQCRALSRDDARHFVDKGYVVVRGAFPETFAAEVGASYPLGVDDSLSVTDNYPFMGLPVTYLIGADGSITRQVNGQISSETLEAFIHHDFGTS